MTFLAEISSELFSIEFISCCPPLYYYHACAQGVSPAAPSSANHLSKHGNNLSALEVTGWAGLPTDAYIVAAGRDSADIMSEKDLDNLLESIDLEYAINELEPSTVVDTKPSKKEETQRGSADTAVSVQVGGAIIPRLQRCRGSWGVCTPSKLIQTNNSNRKGGLSIR